MLPLPAGKEASSGAVDEPARGIGAIELEHMRSATTQRQST
jgi:hypothetical protein